MILIDQETDMLVNIDMQKTFMPGGGLAVTGGDTIVPIARRVTDRFRRESRTATLDLHMEGHISLASSYVGIDSHTMVNFEGVTDLKGVANPDRLAARALFSVDDFMDYMRKVKRQVLWPDHGLYHTEEARLHPAFRRDEFGFILVKGMDPKCDSYSAFYDNLQRPTGLAQILRRQNKRRVFLQGLAFDYCVGFSALGAVTEGFETYVIEDATRPVGYPADSVRNMYAQFRAAGVRLITSADIGA
ncbi:MAG: isochorismatase family protein [bacterium]|nr:isochorismatase family protein [bacterium]